MITAPECTLLLVITSNISCIPMEKTNNVSSCDSRVHSYKNGKTMDQCKEEARKNMILLSKELLENGGGFMDTSIRYGRP